MIKVEIKGDKFRGLGEEILSSLQARGESVVNRGAAVLLAAVQAQLSTEAAQDAGEQADAALQPAGEGSPGAGRPPRKRRGNLLKSIRRTRARTVSNVVSADVYTDHPGAKALEFGGQVGRGKRVALPAHPFFRPATEQARAEVEAILGEL